MPTIKRLSDCTLTEAVQAWNDGFEGYFFDSTMTVEGFVNRMALEGLSPDISVIAYNDNDPIGIVMSGTRVIDGKKVAWNGGTGVALKARKQGIGEQMMKHVLTLYKEEDVKIATLEAISENAKAIALYKKLGYEIVDHLEYLELKGKLDEAPINSSGQFKIEKSSLQKIGALPFYRGQNPWQTHWKSAKEAEGIIIKDESSNVPMGYAYFSRKFDESGNHVGTVLFQCEAIPGHLKEKDILKALVYEIFGEFSDPIRRVVPNLPVKSSEKIHTILSEIGFKPFVKQVYMEKHL